MIDGLEIWPSRQVMDERGKIVCMLRRDDISFEDFGEIYFSYTYPGVIKAWHLHKRMFLNYMLLRGDLKLVLHDQRANSPSRGQTEELFLSAEEKKVIKIPPGVWNGFKCIGSELAILANCASSPHCESEIVRLSPEDPSIPYEWGIRFK